jgi:DNA-binding GntR family transcriptional regulator
MRKPSDEVYETLSQALLTGSLPAGTQLIETRLAAIFDVSRERVRKALHRLGHERLLELVPNKGAFVNAPNLEQARDIYEARRVMEGGIVARLAGRLSPQQIDGLRAHLKAEKAALDKGDRAASIRLSAEFHLLLSEATGSKAIMHDLRELVSRTSMLVALFEESHSSHCGCEEHEAILKQLELGDVSGALNATYAHLSLIETRMQNRKFVISVDVESVLKQAWLSQTKLIENQL